jgi:hypothetical protein
MLIGPKQFLWSLLADQIVWLPAGLKRKDQIVAVLRKHLFREALEISSPELGDRTPIHAFVAQERKEEIIAEIYRQPRASWDLETGLFSGRGGDQVCVSFFLPFQKQREKLISSLQSIGETLNILSFEYRLRLCGRRASSRGASFLIEAVESLGREVEVETDEGGALRLDFVVDDCLGRKWAACSIKKENQNYFIRASVERLLALLIERKA